MLNAEPDFTKDVFENQFKTSNLKKASSLKRGQNWKIHSDSMLSHEPQNNSIHRYNQENQRLPVACMKKKMTASSCLNLEFKSEENSR